MKEIRLGTIGSGMIVHAILDCAKQVEGIRLVAAYSRDRAKGEELAAEYGASKVYTDMDEFLKDEELNVVYVASPNSLHYEQSKKALLAGKHVLCEKPFCTRAEQARELRQIAREKGLMLIDATPTIFLPNLEILKRELPKVGKVKMVMSSYSQYSSRYDKLLAGEVPNVFNPKFAGGCLMDINYYNVYLNVLLFGKPQATVYYPNIYPGLVDTSGVAVMQYDGFVGECVGAKDTWGVNTMQIQGEEGFIFIEGGSNCLLSIRVVTKTSDETFNQQFEENRWLYEVQEVTRVLLNEDHDFIVQGLDVMENVVEVIEGARKAAGIFFTGDECGN